MDKNQKFLNRLSDKEREVVHKLIEQLLEGSIKGLDVKKLKSYADIFRVRSGNIRIIFRRTLEEIYILEISCRSEKTYRDF